jgi:hypothetical protein
MNFFTSLDLAAVKMEFEMRQGTDLKAVSPMLIGPVSISIPNKSRLAICLRPPEFYAEIFRFVGFLTPRTGIAVSFRTADAAAIETISGRGTNVKRFVLIRRRTVKFSFHFFGQFFF